MKKYYYSLTLMAFAAMVIIPAVTQAQDATPTPTPSPSVSATPTPIPANIREKMRLELEMRNQNIKANQGIRNDMLGKKMASSTASTTDKMIRKDLKEVKGDIKDARKDFREDVKDMRMGTSTKKEIRRELELHLFKMHKDILVRQLNLAVTNLKQIRERIVSRIAKAETSGRNMTEPKALLVTADAKILAAQQSS